MGTNERNRVHDIMDDDDDETKSKSFSPTRWLVRYCCRQMGYDPTTSTDTAAATTTTRKTKQSQQTKLKSKNSSSSSSEISRDINVSSSPPSEEEEGEIPKMEDTIVFRFLFDSIQWQRDNYIVGKEYADLQKQQRQEKQQEKQQSQEEEIPNSDPLDLHHDTKPTININPTATPMTTAPLSSYSSSSSYPQSLGTIQLIDIGQSFVPSITTKNALRPLLCDALRGPIRAPLTQATVNVLPLSQPMVDDAITGAMISFLGDEEWRNRIKGMMKNYVGTMQRDDIYEEEE